MTPIRLIAKELYRLIREIEALERAAAEAKGERKEALMDRLRKLRAENRRMRDALDGQKDVSHTGRGFNP